MNTLIRLTLSLALIGGAVFAAYHFGKNAAHDGGNTPTGLDAGSVATGTGGSSASTDPAGSRVAPGPPPAAQFPRGRELFEGADYLRAIPVLHRARRAGEAPGAGAIEAMIQKARLFQLLVEDVPEAELMEGDPLVLVALKRGDPILARLVGETAETVSFKASRGRGARVPKKDCRELTIARTTEARARLLAGEYRRRHDAARGQKELLEVARFARSAGRPQHVTYLLTRALDEPGDEIEEILFSRFEEARDARAMARLDVILDLFKTFFRGSDLRRRAVAEGRPEPAAVPPRDVEVRVDPESRGGIGGVGSRRPKHRDPEVDELLAKADEYRAEGDHHYPKARPGEPRDAFHRQKALAAYREAAKIYEQVEEKWGVNLENTFQNLHQRMYHLIKDTRAR